MVKISYVNNINCKNATYILEWNRGFIIMS